MATPKYSYMENPKHDLTGFKIEDGKYKDVVYTYGKVSPIEESEKLRLKFEYTIHENPNRCNTDSGDFINVIGDILAVEAEKENVKSGNSEEDRENSSQKSNT